jgi:hypothetical protein
MAYALGLVYPGDRATGGIDGVTTAAVQNFQRKVGITPADGDPGVGLFARLRHGL